MAATTTTSAPDDRVAVDDVCCAPTTADPGGIGTVEAEAYAHTFKALGDPTRLRLVTMIAEHDGGEACVCDLTEPLDLGQPTVSHHLRILTEAGILAREKRGVWAYYSIRPGALAHLTDLLARVR
jgi:ArsR family transcriptional regulator, arsenate/arsenite/antimonite-responsive transcriptional repressor